MVIKIKNAHNKKVVSSSLTPATTQKQIIVVCFFFCKKEAITTRLLLGPIPQISAFAYDLREPFNCSSSEKVSTLSATFSGIFCQLFILKLGAIITKNRFLMSIWGGIGDELFKLDHCNTINFNKIHS